MTPKEDLSTGTYSGTFKLVDQIDSTNALTLGPVTVTMTVSQKETVDGVREPEGEYTPSHDEMALGVEALEINNLTSYCSNYYYTLYSGSDSDMNLYYGGKFGRISDVTNKELDAYTGLDPNADPIVYPPNNYGYTPVKEGSDSSDVRDNVARVLYYGYPNDAGHVGPSSSGADQNYNFWNLMANRKRTMFMLATQCAIWHYTDGIDFTGIHNVLSSDPRIQHIQAIYGNVGALDAWGWSDVENLYEYLIGNVDSGGYVYQPNRFDSDTPAVEDAPDDFAVDLYVADNPISIPGYSTPIWTQNLVNGVAKTTSETTDITITKVWNDESDADGQRPDAEEYKSGSGCIEEIRTLQIRTRTISLSRIMRITPTR